MLRVVLRDRGHSTLTEIALREGLPLATAHRLAATLEAEGFIERQTKGCYLPGKAMIEAQRQQFTPEQRLASRLRRPLERLAGRNGILLHFGVLDEGMVTYLVKENGGDEDLFTSERMQLEAYCSAIGKVLLAALPTEELDEYLEAGPFVPLTPNTITDPGAIRQELEVVRRAGYSFDRFEIREDLFCMAVPVTDFAGSTLGGISASFVGKPPSAVNLRNLRRSLQRLAARVMRQDFTQEDPAPRLDKRL